MTQSQIAACRRIARSGAWFLMACICLIVGWSSAAFGQQRTPAPPRPEPLPELALQITLPGSAVRPPLLEIGRGGESGTLLLRRFLTIGNPQVAGDLTGLQISAIEEDGALKIRVSVLFNDLSKQEWWKEKKEKPVGEYAVHEGQTVRAEELIDFGIVPIELGLVRFKNREFKPGEGPPIINMTTSLQVAHLERIGTHYQMTLKNTSGKRVIWYKVAAGGASVAGAAPIASSGPIPDAELAVRQLPVEGAERSGIQISSVVFDDGTFEGDPVEAAKVFAERDGFKIQSPSVLERIQTTMRVSDTELVEETLKLEAGLWTIPEAIDKPSALDFLRAKHPEYDDSIIGILYESLKGGLYNARNHALRELGGLKRNLEANQQSTVVKSESQAQWTRVVLMRLKEDFEKVIANGR